MGWEAEKEEIVQAARHLLSKGLVSATSGNVSMYLGDADGSRLLAITPTSMRYEGMKPEDVVVIDFEGDVIEGYANPSSESLTHIAVYKARSDIKCVIHTHSVYWFATVLGTDYNEIDIEGTLEKPDYLGQDQAVAYLGPRIMHAKKLGLQQGGFIFPVPVGQMGITRQGLLRGALENLVFAIKGNALQLAEVSGIEPSIVCLGGGVTNIRAFPQLAADTLDTAIRVPEMKDPSPLGAAMCAATGVGEYDSLAEAAVEMKAHDRSIEPDKSTASVMEERYERWLSLYRGLEGLSGEL